MNENSRSLRDFFFFSILCLYNRIKTSKSLKSSQAVLPGLVTLISTLTSLYLRSKGKMHLTHVRHEPYFWLCGQEHFQARPKEPSDEAKKGQEDFPQKQEFQSVVQL